MSAFSPPIDALKAREGEQEMKLDSYYERMVKEIRERNTRLSQGAGGDISILLSIIDHLLKEEPAVVSPPIDTRPEKPR